MIEFNSDQATAHRSSGRTFGRSLMNEDRIYRRIGEFAVSFPMDREPRPSNRLVHS
jgi:hypothetical protein